jgi:hypothetical protein
MKADLIKYSAIVSGYTYVYDINGFINVFDKSLPDVVIDDNNVQSIYTSKVNCNTKKDFELEIIYISQKIYEM